MAKKVAARAKFLQYLQRVDIWEAKVDALKIPTSLQQTAVGIVNSVHTAGKQVDIALLEIRDPPRVRRHMWQGEAAQVNVGRQGTGDAPSDGRLGFLDQGQL